MRLLLLLFSLVLSYCSFGQARFAVTLPQNMAEKPLDGRLLVLLSTNNDAEPRFQISDGANTQIVIGVE